MQSNKKKYKQKKDIAESPKSRRNMRKQPFNW